MTDPLPSGFDPGSGASGDFGALARQSGRMLNALGHAQIDGAEDLVTKAIPATTGPRPGRRQAPAGGDRARAEPGAAAVLEPRPVGSIVRTVLVPRHQRGW